MSPRQAGPSSQAPATTAPAKPALATSPPATPTVADAFSDFVWVRRAEPCVLELASKLAREPWTDRPSCVHPVLGAVARAVHDHSSSAGRRALLPLAPAFLNTAQTGFHLSARLVALSVSTALACPGELTCDERARLTSDHQTALYLLADRPKDEQCGGGARWWLPVLDRLKLSEPFYRTFVAPEHAAEAVAIAARTTDGDRDVRLKQLLRQCLAVCGGAATTRRSLPADSGREMSRPGVRTHPGRGENPPRSA